MDAEGRHKLKPAEIEAINQMVLCWLATADRDGKPSVSPKQVFYVMDAKNVLIAHIASPNSLATIKVNPKVCVSAIDVFMQKGFKLYGTAHVVGEGDADFAKYHQFLLPKAGDRFQIKAIFHIHIDRILPVLAPSYLFYPDTTEEDQIAAALKDYNVDKFTASNTEPYTEYFTDFMASAIRQFRYYQALGEKTFEQVNDAALFRSVGEESNTMAVIVNHLHGNMLSRWTDFLTSDGEKEWRQRDGEFEDQITSRSEMMEKWNAGWACLFAALNTVTADNFHQKITIRRTAMPIADAVHRQLAHYAYHIGQIVFLGRMFAGPEWSSLTIPKGQSAQYNAEKFKHPERNENATDNHFKTKN